MSKEPKKKDAEPEDQGGIGMNADGKVNVVPPDQLDERLAEIRKMRKEEGYD
jgi:hypothetical protein